MKKRHLFVFVVLSFSLFIQAASQQKRIKKVPIYHISRNILHHVDFRKAPAHLRHYAPDQVLVSFKPILSRQGIRASIRSYGLKIIRRIPVVNVYLVRIPRELTVEAMVEILKQNIFVRFVRPDYAVHIAVTPNDTFFKDQYALYNTGQTLPVPGSPTGKDRADIKATAAWEETRGDENVIIAVIDTGVDMNHPDLKNKIFSPGKDYVNGDDDATDDNGHGTFVASVAAAETNNNEGIAGVAWKCKILPIKTMDENGDGYYSDVIDAIIWAVDNGVQIINLSLGGDEPDPDLENAVRAKA
jgi:subtilisin family serine protease